MVGHSKFCQLVCMFWTRDGESIASGKKIYWTQQIATNDKLMMTNDWFIAYKYTLRLLIRLLLSYYSSTTMAYLRTSAAHSNY